MHEDLEDLPDISALQVVRETRPAMAITISSAAFLAINPLGFQLKIT